MTIARGLAHYGPDTSHKIIRFYLVLNSLQLTVPSAPLPNEINGVGIPKAVQFRTTVVPVGTSNSVWNSMIFAGVVAEKGLFLENGKK